MRRWWCPLITLLLACSGGDDDKGDKKRPDPVTVVEAVDVVRGDVADLLVASAAVEADAAADLVPKASGMVVSVAKDVGDAVREGETLAVIENVSLDAGAERARAEVRHLEAQLAELEALYGRGAVSEREVEDLRYQVANARTRLREASQSAGETRLTAPFDGVVAAREVKVGELTTQTTRAFRIVDLSELRVRARLPERDVGRVAVGQRAVLVAAYDDDLTAEAQVTRIAPVIDAATGTFEVVLTLADGEGVLRPGQYVSVQLEVDRHEGVLVVPKDAVLYENGAPVAFVVKPAPPEEDADDGDPDDGGDADEEGDAAADADATPADVGPRFVAERRELTLGLTDVLHAEVTDGLSLGERVIVVGHTNLRDGARVREPVPGEGEAAARSPADVPTDEG